MKKSRFTTEQIIGFIKHADVGIAVAQLARQTVSALPASMLGGPSTAAWRLRTQSG